MQALVPSCEHHFKCTIADPISSLRNLGILDLCPPTHIYLRNLTMPSLRSLLVASFSLSTLTLAQTQPQTTEQDLDIPHGQDLRRLLQTLPSQSLHAILDDHLSPKWQDGVFEEEARAIEAIHIDDPSLATRLVEMAKQAVPKFELFKRQNATDTTTSQAPVVANPPTSTDAPAPAPQTTTPAPAPAPATTTSADQPTPAPAQGKNHFVAYVYVFPPCL